MKVLSLFASPKVMSIEFIWLLFQLFQLAISQQIFPEDAFEDPLQNIAFDDLGGPPCIRTICTLGSNTLPIV